MYLFIYLFSHMINNVMIMYKKSLEPTGLFLSSE